ncbi:hypothetical protein AB0G04_24785 [Actinoplanes sp. NPDC023801]|uniref:hypothetical protein n=1 Tax=Actinoplanes sp. NPDC023801 TaxID=3154595 RepID=UPI00340886E6
MRGEDEMTDERAVRLLRPLRGEPEGPARIDVPRAMAEGRRRRVVRRWSGGVALVALTSVTAGGGTLAVSALRDGTPVPVPTVVVTASVTPSAAPAAPAGPTGCRVTRLPTGGVTKALVTAGDPSGRYQTGRLYGTSANTIVWRDGKILARPVVPGGDGRFADVNRSGVAVGSGFVTDDRQQAFIYRNGRVTALDGSHTFANAINDAGVIVGAVGESGAEVPARWNSAGARVSRLPLPAGITVGTAGGIAEDGTVVGTVSPDETGLGSGYLWLPDGTGRPMPMPMVDGRKADFFWPESIIDGWVAGRAVIEEKDSRAFRSFRYRIADGTYEELSRTVIPALIAENGWVAGGYDQLVVLAGDEMVKLPRYPEADDYQVSSISADGRVISGSSSSLLPGDQVGNDPLVWTCK